MMEMLFICANMLATSGMWLLSAGNVVGVTEELSISFYLIFTYFEFLSY